MQVTSISLINTENLLIQIVGSFGQGVNGIPVTFNGVTVISHRSFGETPEDFIDGAADFSTSSNGTFTISTAATEDYAASSTEHIVTDHQEDQVVKITVNSLNSPYVFLTTKPLRRKFYMNEYDVVTLLMRENIPGYALTYEVLYDDDTNDIGTIDLGDVTTGDIIHVPIANTVIGYSLLHPTKTIKKISIYVEEGERLELITDYRIIESSRKLTLVYTNSLGGLDNLVLKRDFQISHNLAMELIGLQADEIDTTESLEPINRRNTKLYRVISDSLSKSEAAAVADMVNINKAYLLVKIEGKDKLVPIVITTNKIDIAGNDIDPHTVSFDFRFKQDEKAVNRAI